MQTENVMEIGCRVGRAFDLARQVERWPSLLPHYRWVRFHRGGPDEGGVVEMAARRRFGALAWPVWWVSEMEVDARAPAVRYRHVRGITRGMEVEWLFTPEERSTTVRVIHRWGRPPLGAWAAGKVVGPYFVHHIADQTLTWLKRRAEEGM